MGLLIEAPGFIRVSNLIHIDYYSYWLEWVGRDGCKKGVCTVNVNSDDMTVEFPHLGIQCVRKKDIAEALKQTQEIRVDPYRQGFGHADNSGCIDLNAVKLFFQVLVFILPLITSSIYPQVFLEKPNTSGKYNVILSPV